MSELAVPYSEPDEDGDPEWADLTNRIIGAAIAVHRTIGPGHPEGVYENALALEFQVCGIPFDRQVVVPIHYRGQEVGTTRLDFVVFGKVVVELKAVEAIAPVHISQCLSYLKAADKRLAILINFNVKKLVDGVRRIAR